MLGIYKMDYYLFQQINNLAGHFKLLDSIGIFFAAYFQYLLAGALLVFLFLGKTREEKIKNYWLVGSAFLAAIISRFVLTEIIKRLAARPRPFETHAVTQLLSHNPGQSFPSGHAAFFFAMSAVVYSYNKKLGWLFFAGSALISVARVFAGAHYPSDILGGALVGIFGGWL
ncbi:MAG: PAP2 family protein, partial [Parcubacteria group bacterium LiPW_39]